MFQIGEIQMDQIISDTKIPIRIAFVKPDGTPNITSSWYEQIEGEIYCATKKWQRLFHIFRIIQNAVLR